MKDPTVKAVLVFLAVALAICVGMIVLIEKT